MISLVKSFLSALHYCPVRLFSSWVASPDLHSEGSWVVSEAETRELVKRRSLAMFNEGIPVFMDTVVPMCEFCGKRRLEEMHHRKFRSQGGKWSPSNIIGLCWQCHKKATVQPGWAYRLGLSVSSHVEADQTPVCVWYNELRVLLNDSGTYTVAT